jgi:7,8-dihydroneopterin aldolase/epimerase/oxygenase
MMDIVYLGELHIDTVIGVHAWERELRQTVVLDLELAWDTRAAAAGDDLGAALDYSAVAEALNSLVGGAQCLLLETLAERCAEHLQREFGVRWLRLRLGKPGAVPGAREVGVMIERGTRDNG